MTQDNEVKLDTLNKDRTPRYCGIIMPISDLDPYPSGHWADVSDVIKKAVGAAGFEGRMVSAADEATVIQKSIVNNLYFDEIAVCDVSSRNPNVMLELGMRLAFDKPVVIIKDEITKNPFDTSPLEFTLYRSDLRYQSIISFQKILQQKIEGTIKAVTKPGYGSFLRAFGQFEFAKIDRKEVSSEEYLINQIQEIKSMVYALKNPSVRPRDVKMDFIPVYLFTTAESASVFVVRAQERLAQIGERSLGFITTDRPDVGRFEVAPDGPPRSELTRSVLDQLSKDLNGLKINRHIDRAQIDFR